MQKNICMSIKSENILPFNWRTELENIESYTIDDDIILVDNPVITSTFNFPFRMDVSAGFVCIRGTSEYSVNLKPYTATAPCLITILPGQILEYKYISDDFTGLFVILSPKFADSLISNTSEHLPLFNFFRENPVIPLDKVVLGRMIGFFELLKQMAQEKNHPYRLETVRYLTLAFLYGAGDFHPLSENRKISHQEMLVENFMNLVRTHHKKQRELRFYAKKMTISPKYLSKVIKETSGRPANDWIDDHVTLEAKALLKSTNMNIQQISEELNFPSQSFFGKYFKRVTGMSPSEYKGKG